MIDKRVLALDPGIANCGVAVMEYTVDLAGPLPLPAPRWVPIDMLCLRTEKSSRKLGLRQSDDDARRVGEITRALKGLCEKWGLHRMVAELPNTGAQDAKSAKWLAYAGAMTVTFAETMSMAVEYYTPLERLVAAKVPGSLRGDAQKKAVIASMRERYPIFEQAFPHYNTAEHVADALATFEAARIGVLIRTIEA